MTVLVHIQIVNSILSPHFLPNNGEHIEQLIQKKMYPHVSSFITSTVYVRGCVVN